MHPTAAISQPIAASTPNDNGHVEISKDGQEEGDMPVPVTTVEISGQLVDAAPPDPATAQDLRDEKIAVLDHPHCVFPERSRMALVVFSSWACLVSPLSSTIFLPAITAIADSLDTSVTLVNLSISTFMIFQGIAPSFAASFSERYGRRPVYLICFLISVAANVGLALQTNYAALMILRCLQSSGSSGTIALSIGVVTDISTRAERGKIMGFASMGVTLGPSLGPVIGGLLSHFLGWRANFWFLAIFCGVFGVFLYLVYPETERSIVGNGSIPPPKWNRSVLQIISQRLSKQPPLTPQPETLQARKIRPTPFTSVKILRDPEILAITLYSAVLFAGYASVTSTLSSQLSRRFHYNSIQTGLCYIPSGFGSLTSRWSIGLLTDWNFKREARRQGLEISKNRQQDISKFNIEKARLVITVPFVALAGAGLLAYGWCMQREAPLAVILVMLFLEAHFTTGAFTNTNTLTVDICSHSAASAAAANNLARCLIAAGWVAAANPIIEAIGVGWLSTITVGAWVLASPALWWVYVRGFEYRKGRAERKRVVEEGKGRGV